MARKPIILWGAAGHARVMRDGLGADRIAAVFDRRSLDPGWDVPCFLGREGFRAWRKENTGDFGFGIAIGGGRGADRLEIADWLTDEGLTEETMIHPHALIEPSARIGRGAQIHLGAALCADAQIGRQTIVNTSAIVNHDCRVGDGAHVGPGANICGEVEIGDLVFIGAGAVVLPRLVIGRGATIGAGAVVTADVQAGACVVGVPARPLRDHA